MYALSSLFCKGAALVRQILGQRLELLMVLVMIQKPVGRVGHGDMENCLIHRPADPVLRNTPLMA